MPESGKVKYIGDIINKSGHQRATIKDRQSKGYGLVGAIFRNRNNTKKVNLGSKKTNITQNILKRDKIELKKEEFTRNKKKLVIYMSKTDIALNEREIKT